MLTFNNQTKHWYLFFTTIVPVIAIAFILIFKIQMAEWQSGRFDDYLEIFIGYPTLLYFLPFFGFSIASMITLYKNFDKYKNKAWVKVGIFSGFILSLKYLILGYASFLSNDFIFILFPIALAIGLFVFFWAFNFVEKNSYIKHILMFILMFLIFGLIIFYRFAALPDISGPILIASIYGGPVWASILSGALNWQLLHHQKGKEKKEFSSGLAVYSLAYGGTLYLAIQKTLEVYNKLPKYEPSCFLATAAAKGHSSFVGSWLVSRNNGSSFKATKQLQYCRFFEIIFQQTNPKLHQFTRSWYNKFGPKLASKINSPFVADMIYIGFKPVEWLGKLGIIVWPDFKDKVEKFYKDIQ